MRIPVRTDAPYCPKCGGTLPFHWDRTDGKSCSEEVERAYETEYAVGLDASGPGAVSPARDRGQILDTRS